MAARPTSYVAGLVDFREGRVAEWVESFANACREAAVHAAALADAVVALQREWMHRAGRPRADSADALSNNHGAVALTTANPSDSAKTSFVVWTQAGTSRVVIGEPEAWSPDGTRLAVWHSTAPPGPLGIGYQETGWVEVLSWPDLRSVASLTNDSFVPQPTSFDPSGRYLLASKLGLSGSSILDLATGQTVGPSGVTGPPVWDRASDLLVPATDGSVTTYPISGRPGTTQAGVGDSAASSTDGSTIVLYFSNDYSPTPRPITLVHNGVSRTISVPGGLESDPVIAPDGSGVVIVCLVHHLLPSEETEALLLVG